MKSWYPLLSILSMAYAMNASAAQLTYHPLGYDAAGSAVQAAALASAAADANHPQETPQRTFLQQLEEQAKTTQLSKISSDLNDPSKTSGIYSIAGGGTVSFTRGLLDTTVSYHDPVTDAITSFTINNAL